MRESYDIRDSHSTYKTVNYYYKSMPCNVDYSTKAQVKAWIYGGDLPRSVLSCEALIDEVNREIKKRTVKAVKTYDDIDNELEKALGIQLGRYQNEKN